MCADAYCYRISYNQMDYPSCQPGSEGTIPREVLISVLCLFYDGGNLYKVVVISSHPTLRRSDKFFMGVSVSILSHSISVTQTDTTVTKTTAK